MSVESERKEVAEKIWNGMPTKAELKAMSFSDLAIVFDDCKKKELSGVHVIEREMKKRISEDQAKIDQKNIIFGAKIAGLWTILGAILGATATNYIQPIRIAGKCAALTARARTYYARYSFTPVWQVL